MTEESDIHFASLPEKYRSKHYSEWLEMACFRLLQVVGKENVPSKDEMNALFELLKKDDRKSTRIRMTKRCEGYFQKLQKRYELEKIETFLFVFHHIETDSKTYYDKSKTMAQSA